MKPIRAAALLVWLAGFAWPAFAQTHAYSVYADLDNDPATGCTIATPAGPVAGIEAVLTAAVSVDPVVVTGQHLAHCEAGALGAPTAVAGAYPYPVGFDQGADGWDVIELGAPLHAFGAAMNNTDWRLTFGSEGALLGGADLTGSVLVPGLGFVPLDPTFIPATSLFALALLALALAIGTAWMARRRPQLFSILVVAWALGLSGLAWAAVHVLDGGIGDWSVPPLLSDPQGDATQDEPPIDIRQAFATQQGGNVFFRIDVEETRLSVLLPPLLDTGFSIAENSPNGTVLGPVRPSSTGLSSILALSQTGQAPAAGFAFDPSTTVLSVGDAALLDFETHAQFQLDFSATLAGLPGYALPVTVNIDIQDVNETPVLAAQSFTVLEHAATGTAVGTVAASDPDAGANGQLTYAIAGGSGQPVFAIDAASGALTVADAVALDLSASPYDLDVTVSDGGSPPLVAGATMTVSVVDVNDAPSFTPGGDVTVAEDSGAYDAPWATALSDGDDGSQTLEFEIVANDNPALFVVAPALSVDGATGRLAFTPAADANGVASLTVVLRDNGGTDNGGVDETAPVSLDIVVTAVNDAPELTVPGTQESDGSSAVVFSAANGNAISATDVDAGTGIVAMTFSASAGTLTLADPDAALAITGNGSGSVSATGTLAALNAALNGASGALTYVPTPGDTVARTLTIGIDDQGHTGAGGALSDSATIDIDAPPTIAATPAAGLVPTDAAFTLTFSEPVDVAAGAVTLSCNGAPNLITGGDTGAGVTTLAPTYAGPLPEGQTCVLAVAASGVGDSDGVDPPDHPIADFSRSYSVDAAPTVTATSPADGAVVANDATLSVTFSEAVDAIPGAITLSCNGGANLVTGWDSGTGVTTLTPSYTAPLPAGSCTLTVVAAHIDDSDVADPPANLVADHVVNFTVDAAPAFVSAVPAEGDAIANTGSVSFTFDEAVNDLGGAIALDCGGPVAGTLTGSGTATLTFTPDAPLAEGAACTATAVASNIGDSDDADPPEHPAADVSRNFTVDAAPGVISVVPANGDIDVGLDANIVVTFSEPVNFAATAFSLACPDGTAIPFTVTGDGTNVATIDPTPAMLPIDTLCAFTVDAAQVTDVDNADPPDAGSGVTAIGFTTVNDNPPSVVSSTPGDGDTVANDVALSIAFSEAVNVTANAVTLTCGGGNLVTGGDSGSNVTALAPTYAAPLPSGTCILTVLAAHVTDVDTIDPPDEMPADYVATFTVDAAPAVVSTSPADGASDLPTDTAVSVTFSEAVTAGVPSFAFACDGTPVAFGVTGSGTDTVTLTPATALPGGASCTVTALAAGVEDVDTFDPPNEMAANHAWSFTTDAPPAVASTVPASAAVVNTSPTITVNFSEQVNLDSGAFVLNCGGAIATTPSPALPATGITAIAFTPDTALPEGASCTATVLAGAVHDADSNDPPDTMEADHAWSFTVDAAPGVVSIVPAHGASDVDPTGNIVVAFSESVNFDTTPNAANASFDLECPAGTPVDFTVATASPATSVTLNPLDNAVAGRTCTLTVRAAGISDADSIDPPDQMGADAAATFSFGAIANDDSVNVTPHLTVGTAGGAINLTANDILGAGQITGFGFGSCTGTAPGSQLDAGTNNGRLTLAADGSFTYEPPASVANATRTFCYTVTGGDTANVAFAIQNTELVWFVDAAAAAGGIGTQARPFNALPAAGPVHTTNDTIFVASHASPYLAGITLFNGVRLVGQGASGTLAAHSGVTPVSGSAFPALGGGAPTFTASNATAITLGNGNALRGFVVGDSGATGGTDIAGSNFGILNVSEVALTGNGRALSLDTGTVAGSGFTGVTVTASGSEGLRLNAVAGTLALGTGAIAGTAANVPAVHITGGMGTLAYAGSIAKTNAGRLVEISGAGSGTITLGGNLSCTASCGSGVHVAGRTGGTITFSGTGKTFATGANPAVNLATNTGTTIHFTEGGMDIDTTTGNGFNATGGGTVTVQGAGNTIDAGSGTGLNVANTTIGSAGLAFQRIATNGGTNGIVLNNTGASGGLTVTGLAGAPGSGGTIQNTAGAGIVLNTTQSPSFDRMVIQNASGDGVKGTGVTHFSFTNGTIGANGNACNLGLNQGHSGIALDGVGVGASTRNVSGTVTITGNTITNPYCNGIGIANASGTIDLLTISNNTIISASSPPVAGQDGWGIMLRAYNSASTVANVTRAQITGNTIRNFPHGGGIEVSGRYQTAGGPSGSFGVPGHATNVIRVSDNRISGFSAANRMNTHAILALVSDNTPATRSQANFVFQDNGVAADTMRHTSGTTVALSAFGHVDAYGLVDGNVIVANNTFASQGVGGGSAQAEGANDAPVLLLETDNNDISQVEGNGILLVAREARSILRTRIRGNTVAAPTASVRPGIRVDSGNSTGTNTTVCMQMSGNTTAGSGGHEGIGLRKEGSVPTTHAFGVVGMSATATPGVETYVGNTGQNPGAANGSFGITGVLLIASAGMSGFTNCTIP